MAGQVWGRFQMQICCKHTARQAHTPAHTPGHTRAHTLKTQLEEITLALRHLRSVSKCQKWNINILGPHLGRILRGGAHSCVCACACLSASVCVGVCAGVFWTELGNVDS